MKKKYKKPNITDERSPHSGLPTALAVGLASAAAAAASVAVGKLVGNAPITSYCSNHYDKQLLIANGI